jgi:eukaryotic-like serine/threonine-protein kinase
MDKIGAYQIVETLHRGAQPLFKARAKDGQMVALKALPVAALSAEMRERFTREAETCRKLDHPNLVRVFDMGEADGMLYQAMELLEGADLGKVMAENRPFTWDQKLGIMEQVCDGLEYAHAQRLVHRDIKPANLFLENSGRVRVLDFGMVRVAESELTKVGSSLGTLNYMAPEQVRGDRCTAATDVFSAGIVFYQLAAGRHPFSARDRSLAQVVSAIVFETPPKLSSIVPDVPEGLEFLLNRSLEKDPSKRLQNAGELKGAIALCRMTLSMGIPRTAVAEPEKTRVMQSIGTAVAEPVAADPEKTRVIRRPVPQAAPPPPPPPPPAPVAAAPPPRPTRDVPAPALRYCPACTSANPAAATACLQCKTPFSSSAPAPAAPKQNNLALYVAVGVALVLALTLIVVLMKK